MLADRERQRPARRRRRDHLHAGAVGQGRGEQGMLAADPLMRDRGDLAGEPLQRRLVELGRVVPLDLAADRLDPELAGPVDVDVGDVGPRQHPGQRRQIGAKIDARAVIGGGLAHRLFSAPVKSRSRATKIEMLVPARTVRVGVIWAGWTIWVAPWSEPGRHDHRAIIVADAAGEVDADVEDRLQDRAGEAGRGSAS